MKKLRIAQLVLPWIPLPPPGYAGTERVVYNLTQGLVQKGHEVTLFSVGESKTSAKLQFIFEKGFTLQSDVIAFQKASFYPMMHVANCFQLHKQFDIIHSHAQMIALPFAAIVKTPTVHTFHREFAFNDQDVIDLVMHYKNLNYVSISNSQRSLPLNFVQTVYNGTDTTRYVPSKNPTRDYLFWAGRIIEKKGPHVAISVAKSLGMKLIIAGKITEKEYFEEKIAPMIDGVNINLVENSTEDEMIKFYQNAKATLFPIEWNEPFGLIPVESMACGTPAVAFAKGAVKETILDGKTGYLIDPTKGADGFRTALSKIDDINPEVCREHVVNNFSNEQMIDNYEKAYEKIISAK